MPLRRASRRRSCSTLRPGSGLVCRVGPVGLSGGCGSRCRSLMTCAMTPRCDRYLGSTRSAARRCSRWPRRGRSTPSTPRAGIAGPPMNAWPPTPGCRCAPCSALMPRCDCWGWPPRCCAVANAPVPSGWRRGELETGAAAGPACGRCTATPVWPARSQRCHPIPKGLFSSTETLVLLYSLPPAAALRASVDAALRAAPARTGEVDGWRRCGGPIRSRRRGLGGTACTPGPECWRHRRRPGGPHVTSTPRSGTGPGFTGGCPKLRTPRSDCSGRFCGGTVM